MKHAYLILAHNEFDLLSKLVGVIDDPRNDIFIHIDSKVNHLPVLNVFHSSVYFTSERVDVRWGDITVVEAEYLLFEKAFRTGQYSYYHLLSGVDLPIKSQDRIHTFFEQHEGEEFIGFNSTDDLRSLDRKVNRYHMFPKNFKNDGSLMGNIKRACRALALRVQLFFGIRRNTKRIFKKGTQWISVTGDFVKHVLSEKQSVMETYVNTFCPDEIFIQTICWNSDFRDKIHDVSLESVGSQRLIDWKENVIHDWQDKDFDRLISSDLLFARKFSSNHVDVVDRIIQNINASNPPKSNHL